jgi:branched-chain amino acid aminotransferase
LLVKTLALRSGYDEAVILDSEGFVAECSGENLFMVRDHALYTPPRAAVLEGITRDSVLTLAADLGISIHEELITRDQLYIADEVFITGTAAELVPIRMIDFRQVGEGRPGPVYHMLLNAYLANVHGQGVRSNEWLEYIGEPQAVEEATR